MTLGSRIAALRAAQGLSQAELAEVLEVSRQSVSKWETDASVPELDKLLRLAEIFGITLDELVKGDESGREVPGEAVQAPEPAPGVGTTWQPLRVTVGSLLLLFGALLALIFSLQGNGLRVVVVIALPFLGCGMVCLLFKELLPLWCGWCVFLWVSFCEIIFPMFFGSNDIATYTLFALMSALPLFTGWCLRNRLLASPKRRYVFFGSWVVGAVIFRILRKVGCHFYGTYIMALSHAENERRWRFGFVMLMLSVLVALALISTAFAALFYGAGRLRRKLSKKKEA